MGNEYACVSGTTRGSRRLSGETRRPASLIERLEPRQLLSGALPAAAPPGSAKLTGALIGTVGSYGNKGNTISNAIDGNPNTYFDAPAGVVGWLGLDMGSAQNVTQVQYVPRGGYASRMVGGVFQGSNTADFSDVVSTLFSVTSLPAGGVYTSKPVSVAGSFRYVRYLAPANGSGNVAEVEFDGTPAVLTPPPPIPMPPTGAAAVSVSATDVHLSWQEDPSSIVSSFTIQRQGPTDSGFVVIGTTSGAVTTFDDLTANPITTYSYEVIATNLGGSSSSALPASVSTPQAPVNPWTDTDIGIVGLAGSAMVNPNGSIAVNGSGADIWNQTDAFNFESQSLVGNGSIVAQVSSQSNTNSWAKSGIMIRESLNADSRFVLIALTPSNGVTFQARTATHTTPSVFAVMPGKAGVWLKLTRSGSSFSGFSSSDGVSWILVGTANIPMVNNVFAGMCVTAHNSTRISAATFSNVSMVAMGTEASAWSVGATAPIPRWESESFSYNGQLYVFGGYVDRSLNATAECDAYNPATNTWNYVTTIPIGGLTHAAVSMVGDTVYFAGGNIGIPANPRGGAVASVLSYDLTTGVWGSIASLPAAGTSGGLVNINNQLIYYGGLNGTNTADLSNTWALDLTNPTAGWIAEASMPNARNHVGYAQISGIAYAIGGQHLYKQTTGNDPEVDAYNPVTNTWAQVASLPMGWSGIHTSTMVVNGKIVIVGGQTNGGYDGIYLSTVEEYDPVSNTWTLVGNLPEANEGASVAYINGQLIVSSGTVDNLGGWAQRQTWINSEISL